MTLDCKMKLKKLTMPVQLAAFILSISKRIMNNFIHAINGFYTNDLYYEDTDSMNLEKKHWEKKIKLD